MRWRVKRGLSVLAVAVVLGGALLAMRTSVGAANNELTATGTLTLTPDGAMVVDDGTTSYNLVSAIPLSPYLEKKVVLGGTYDGEALFVRELTLGAIRAQYLNGAVNVTMTGIVEAVPDGYKVTVEGVPFILVGSNQLGEVTGEVAVIQGNLIGAEVTLASLTTDKGAIEILPPASHADLGLQPNPDPGSWDDD